MSEQNRVLSIQSHVVHGYCGNKSAVFPLQLLNFDVDAINSVQLSNHTGYEHIKGQILSETDLADLFNGLTANKLHLTYSHLLTGYVGNDKFLREISRIIKELRASNPNLIYVCDPVMGDAGKMYVPESLLPIYRDEIIPLADLATPNQFEVELLTGKKILNEKDAWNGMQWFHDQGVKLVALSSTEFSGTSTLIAFLSFKKPDGTFEKYKLSIPKKAIHLTGTGDLFAALLLAHTTRMPNDLGRALELTIASVQSVIDETINSMTKEMQTGQVKVTAQQRELKIIQSKKHIESPIVKLRANKVD
ncbi:CLUMA_CG017553, isoform A [Clunio marinus]|uniref:Pyridoxal kinase n=1 Tax=Clunio marinus TaxID=568069 RepID=A0A1J1IWC9_9DIPT|nr:CLUMA_CG017553, isoform A [Clunio marinus]